jgi:hypothetical protein
MTHDPNGTPSSEQAGSESMGAIEADIAHTRAELADTVDQLTAKLDVKTRTRQRLHQTSDQVTETVVARAHALRDRATDENGRPTRTTLSVGGGAALAVVAFVALALWRRSR